METYTEHSWWLFLPILRSSFSFLVYLFPSLRCRRLQVCRAWGVGRWITKVGKFPRLVQRREQWGTGRIVTRWDERVRFGFTARAAYRLPQHCQVLRETKTVGGRAGKASQVSWQEGTRALSAEETTRGYRTSSQSRGIAKRRDGAGSLFSSSGPAVEILTVRDELDSMRWMIGQAFSWRQGG